MKAAFFFLALFVAAVFANPCPTSDNCNTCVAVSGCGLCSAKTTSGSTNTCGSLTASATSESIYGFCNNSGGVVLTACPSTVQATAPATAPATTAPATAPATTAPATASCLSDNCAICYSKNGCGFCKLPSGAGQCKPISGTESLQTYCVRQNGTITGSEMCSPVNPPATATAPATAPATASCLSDNCAICNSKPGCGFCKLPSGAGQCRPMSSNALIQDIQTYCLQQNGIIIGNEQCTLIPTPVVQDPVQIPTYCTSKSCTECLADARCGFCSGAYSSTASGESSSFGVCRAREGTLNGVSLSDLCTSVKGTLSTSGQCPGPNVDPAPVTQAPTTSDSDTDNVCKPRTTCGGCFERPECGLCHFKSGSAVCRGKTLTVNGETGPVFCQRESGFWNAARATTMTADLCTATDAAESINTGKVTEAQVNTDIQKKNPLDGYVVVVTVIAQAAAGKDGKATFQTFVDISGPSSLNDVQKGAVCDALKSSLSTRLSVSAADIDCTLTLKTTKKRQTQTYVANLGVGGASNMQAAASGVFASVALIASALLALF